MAIDVNRIKALIVLPAPLDVCVNCGEQLILVLSEHCDEQVIFHRSKLEAVIGDKVIILRNRIRDECPNKVEI